MSVYIKGMKMPKNCLNCPLLGTNFNCRIVGNYEDEIDNLNERREDCPLISVPEHGELVDRQELLKEQLPLMDGGFRVAAVRVMNICSAKVFIPADKEEET